MSDVSVDTIVRVWDDDLGSRVEIGEDSDGMGLLEIRAYERDDRVPVVRISFSSIQQALLTSEAIRAIAEKLEKELERRGDA